MDQSIKRNWGNDTMAESKKEEFLVSNYMRFNLTDEYDAVILYHPSDGSRLPARKANKLWAIIYVFTVDFSTKHPLRKFIHIKDWAEAWRQGVREAIKEELTNKVDILFVYRH